MFEHVTRQILVIAVFAISFPVLAGESQFVEEFSQQFPNVSFTANDAYSLKKNADIALEVNGLNPISFNSDLVAGELLRGSDEGYTQFVSYAYRVAEKLSVARVQPDEVIPEKHLIDVKRQGFVQKLKLMAMLQAKGFNNLAGWQQFAPQYDGYKSLQKAYLQVLDLSKAIKYKAKYRKDEGPLSISKNFYRLGDTHPEIAGFRRRLINWGYDSDFGQGEFFDKGLESAVKWFQQFAGLKPDGIVGPNTLEALNNSKDLSGSIEALIGKFKINLDRWRWLPNRVPNRYIVVQLGVNQFDLYDLGNHLINMRTITGKRMKEAVVNGVEKKYDVRTPIIFDTVQQVLLKPFWMPTPNILERMVEDSLKKYGNRYDEFYKNHFVVHKYGSKLQIFSLSNDLIDKALKNVGGYKLAQKSGPHNALGHIQFRFGSSDRTSIYMHDTPTRQLFREDERFHSSGCIRLAKPFDLAAYLLRDYSGKDQSWNTFNGDVYNTDHVWDYIKDANSTEKFRVSIRDRSVDFYSVYFTIYADAFGNIQSVEDRYDYDEIYYARYENAEGF